MTKQEFLEMLARCIREGNIEFVHNGNNTTVITIKDDNHNMILYHLIYDEYEGL